MFSCNKCVPLQEFSDSKNFTKHNRTFHQKYVKVLSINGVQKSVMRSDDGQFHCICGYFTNVPVSIQRHVKQCVNYNSQPPSTLSQEHDNSQTRPVDVSVEEIQTEANLNSNLIDGMNVADLLVGLESIPAYDGDNDEGSDESGSPLCETEYDTSLKSHGVVIHRLSGALICLSCSLAVEPTNLNGHLTKTHKVQKDWWKTYLGEGTFCDLEDYLHELGARTFRDMGLYYAPNNKPVPIIGCLPHTNGFVCGICPDNENTMTAYYSGTESTMMKHFSLFHRGSATNNYKASWVQSVFSMQAKKVYIGVEKLYQGPTVVSTITEEGERLLSKFLEDSSVAVHFRNDVCIENGADDNRIVPRFYQEVNWFSLVEKVTGEDNRENRVELYDWVHVKGNNDEVIYDKIIDWTRSYFANIQTILADSTQDHYYYRTRVMESTAMDIQTTGLSCLSDESCKKYADTWARLVVMIIRAVDGRNETFSDFGRVCLTREMEDSARKFLNCIKLEVVGNSGSIGRKIQEFFLFLVRLPNPPGHERHKSMITLFMAFSQISHDGQWKQANAASAAPARLRYCMRSIVLKEIIDQESQ